MNDSILDIAGFSKRSLEERTYWYSKAAQAYNKVRPHYPAALILFVAEMTQLKSYSKILEIGCGPGTLTIDLAALNCSIRCIEPNPDFCELARRNCRQYPKVLIEQSSFEKWPVETSAYEIVVSASAFHWIQPEIGYPKVASALCDNGYFVLLWNKVPQPSSDICDLFAEIYRCQGLPFLGQFETEAMQQKSLAELAKPASDSGLFKKITSKQMKRVVKYSADDYLLLLSSFSPYLRLDEFHRNSLFAALSSKINEELNGMIDLSYIAAADIFQKNI